MSRFIATEIFGDKGEAGERLVWDSLKRAFGDRDCLAYWRYPVFSNQGKFRKEPDILIADRNLGLIVIEVKGIRIEQLVSLQGHRWQYRNFYTESGNPYQQAERQLFALLEYCDREPLLKGNITSKAIIALPYITKSQWQTKGFDRLPNSPPILFQEDLSNSQLFIDLINKIPPVRAGIDLTSTQWELLLAILSGTSLAKPNYRQLPCKKNSRRHIIAQTRSRLSRFDLEWEKIAKQIPQGMQRIRGVAGSGKTVLLCQKAALMAVKYPNWQIALVFFSRSLYDVITEQVTKWIGHYTQNKVTYNPELSNVTILHAWGSKEQPGFYSYLCQSVKYTTLAVPFTISKQPTEALAEACLQLLENRTIAPLFDAVLIDEAQDLLANDWNYQDKQPFFWLAYQSLREIDPIKPEQRRLIWADDELQSLSSLKIAEPGEMFGEELGHLVTGKYNREIKKTELLSRCYRTPHQVVFVAHAVGMGLIREEGIITGSNNFEEWQALGYAIAENKYDKSQLTLKRPIYNSPNLIPKLSSKDTIFFDRFISRQQEFSTLAQRIKENIERDDLQPDKEILIIVLGDYYDSYPLIKQVAIFLINQGINIYLPAQSTFNTWETLPESQQRDRFWYPGAITISNTYRAKGQEVDMLYIIGLDKIARRASNLYSRQQLLVALTRTRAWVNISGIGNYSLYDELDRLINSQQQISINLNNC